MAGCWNVSCTGVNQDAEVGGHGAMNDRIGKRRGMDRGRFVRVLLAGIIGSMLNQGWALAVPPQHHEHPNAAGVRPQPAQLTGRVVAVRRLTRVVTIQTTSGAVRAVSITPEARIHAHGAAGLNAIRSGADVEMETVSGRSGTLTARSVIVR